MVVDIGYVLLEIMCNVFLKLLDDEKDIKVWVYNFVIQSFNIGC